LCITEYEWISEKDREKDKEMGRLDQELGQRAVPLDCLE